MIKMDKEHHIHWLKIFAIFGVVFLVVSLIATKYAPAKTPDPTGPPYNSAVMEQGYNGVASVLVSSSQTLMGKIHTDVTFVGSFVKGTRYVIFANGHLFSGENAAANGILSLSGPTHLSDGNIIYTFYIWEDAYHGHPDPNDAVGELTITFDKSKVKSGELAYFTDSGVIYLDI